MIRRARLLLLLALALAAPASAQVLFQDNFDGTSIDPHTWAVARWNLGRTNFGLAPTVVDGVATLHLDTYAPTAPLGFMGTEIWSLQQFNIGNGLEMSARVRTNALPDGIVSSFFADNFRSTPGGGIDNNEIDFEALSSQNNHQQGSSTLALTTWHDWGTAGSAYFDNVHHSSQYVTTPGLDLSQFNTYTIRWLPDHTEWLVNGQLLRSTPLAHAQGPMELHFNFWAASPKWIEANSPTLLPAASALLGQDFTYDIDSVTVKAINPLMGDTNLDGTVNLADLLALAQNYGKSGTNWATGDLNGDGVTDFQDLTILAQSYGRMGASQATAPAVVAVPEPAACYAIATLPFLLHRRRRWDAPVTSTAYPRRRRSRLGPASPTEAVGQPPPARRDDLVRARVGDTETSTGVILMM